MEEDVWKIAGRSDRGTQIYLTIELLGQRVCANHEGTVPGPVHPIPTAVNHRCYFFYVKHHSPANIDDAQWLPGLPLSDEFGVFDLANRHDLSSSNGNLFGLRIREGLILDLGMLGEQVAMFPVVRGDIPWHGYPLWPLAKDGGPGGRVYPPPRQALKKMEDANLITAKQRRRLSGGRHI